MSVGCDRRLAECLATLELSQDTTRSALHSAYRRLCKRYHPDRFAGDPERLAAATELLAAINAAYAYARERIGSELPSGAPSRAR